jgi:pentatricopeptide repeat protein
LRRAHELDPLSHIIINNYGDVLYHARLYDQAIEQYRKTLELVPEFRKTVTGIGLVYLENGMFEEAIIELGTKSSYSVYAFMSLGKEEKALELLEHYKELSIKQYVSPRIFLNAYIGMGDLDKAFEYLEKMYDERSPWIMDKVIPEPFYDRIRSDPRYALFLQKMGLEK